MPTSDGKKRTAAPLADVNVAKRRPGHAARDRSRAWIEPGPVDTGRGLFFLRSQLTRRSLCRLQADDDFRRLLSYWRIGLNAGTSVTGNVSGTEHARRQPPAERRARSG